MGIIFNLKKWLFPELGCHQSDLKPGDVWDRELQGTWSPSRRVARLMLTLELRLKSECQPPRHLGRVFVKLLPRSACVSSPGHPWRSRLRGGLLCALSADELASA